jgi:hypothetical protein
MQIDRKCNWRHRLWCRYFSTYLGAFFKTAKKRISASSCMSVRAHRTTRLPLDGFSWNFIFEYFFLRKSVGKIQVSLTSDKNDGHFTWRWIYSFTISRWFLTELQMFQTKIVQKMKHAFYNIYRCTVRYGIYILFTHQQMHFSLNLEKFKFVWKYT